MFTRSGLTPMTGPPSQVRSALYSWEKPRKLRGSFGPRKRVSTVVRTSGLAARAAAAGIESATRASAQITGLRRPRLGMAGTHVARARRRCLAGLEAVEHEGHGLPGPQLDAGADVAAVGDLQRMRRRQGEVQ